MIASALSKRCAQNGLRPFDPRRDSKPVIELIAVAFGDRLGPAGQAALAEMRRIVRWDSLLRWFYWPGASGVMPARGFVWVEEGRVVGNASLRRAPGWGGFLIGNVAVHHDWRGRGIAGELVEAALGEVATRDGRWVGLEVRADNQVARRLYERLGFREVGRTVHMLRPAGLPLVCSPPSHFPLRRGRCRDSTSLVKLVHAIVPEPLRPLLELRRRDYQLGWEHTLDCWLDGRREVWWVIEEHGTICGAVQALRERGRRPDRLKVLVALEHSGRFETVLVQQGVASLRGGSEKIIETVLVSPTLPLVQALKEVGFQRERVLIQMKR